MVKRCTKIFLNFNEKKKRKYFIIFSFFFYQNNSHNACQSVRICILNTWRNKRGCVIWILSYYCVACFKAQYSIATWIFYSCWTPIQLQCFEYASKLCFVYRCGTCLQPEVFVQNRYPTRDYIPRNVGT